MTNDPNHVTERLASSETGMQPWLWLPLLKLLVKGDPVDIADLAAATGRPINEIRTALDAMSDTEYDSSGRIIGQGLTQRPTPHRFEVNGEQLYTWCALDTLIFPTLLGSAARIESAHKGTGTLVRVYIGPSGVTAVEPPTAVVSLVNPEDMSSVRSSFCNEVHYFASSADGASWLENHPRGTVIPVAEAYRLASALAEQLLAQTQAPHTRNPGIAARNCSC